LTAAATALCVSHWLWRKYRPYPIPEKLKISGFITGWKPALPFALFAGINVVNNNIDIIMLGAYVADSDIGIYRISSRVATIISFGLVAVNMGFAPRISSLYSSSEFSQLQSLASKAALATSVFGLSIFMIFIFLGHWILELFGTEFSVGTGILSVLSFGQLFQVLLGSAGLLLMMTNYASSVAFNFSASAVLNIILNFIFIPKFGPIGAAYATCTSLIAVNLINGFLVWKYLKINPTMLGFKFKRY
jgi:O-antigen/teichoic acid export membrane protein